MRFAFPPYAVGAGSGNDGVVPARAQEGDQIAAVVDDVAAQLDPGHTIQLLRLDAEITADIGENGGDGAAAVPGGDFLEGGRTVDERAPSRGVPWGGWSGGARLAWRWRPGAGTLLHVLAAAGAVAESFLERGGAEQAARDAGEDQRETAGVESQGDEVEVGEEMGGGRVL